MTNGYYASRRVEELQAELAQANTKIKALEEGCQKARGDIWAMWNRVHKAHDGLACAATFEAKEAAIAACDALRDLVAAEAAKEADHD